MRSRKQGSRHEGEQWFHAVGGRKYGPPKYTIGANNEVARDVLRRALDTIFRDNDEQMIWLVYYGWPEDQYGLNLVSVPKVAKKKGG